MAIVGPIIFKNRQISMLVPILAMFIGDIIIGFHSYQFIVYLTILSIIVVSPKTKNYFFLGLTAFLSSFWFYVTTNFAVWIMWDFYPKTIAGLINCYVLAIPFFSNTLISTLLFTGILTILIKYLESINEKTNTYINHIFSK